MDEKTDAPPSPSNASPPSSSNESPPSSSGADAASPGLALRHVDTATDEEGPQTVAGEDEVEGKSWWKFKFRKFDDNGET